MREEGRDKGGRWDGGREGGKKDDGEKKVRKRRELVRQIKPHF